LLIWQTVNSKTRR